MTDVKVSETKISSIMNNLSSQLSDKEKQMIETILKEYDDVFSCSNDDFLLRKNIWINQILR